MIQLLFIFSVIAVISVSASLTIFCFGHRRAITDLRSTINKVNGKFYEELATIDLSKLSQTESGRELLVLLDYSEKKEFRHPQDRWLDFNYRQYMISRARENERRERKMMIDSRTKKTDIRNLPLAE